MQVQRIYDRGVKSVIPLFQGKSPGFAEWQKITDEEAQKKIWGWNDSHDQACNYGIRLGKSFGDIVDIDLDSKESRLLAKHYLPVTTTFGRGGVVTHHLFHAPGVKASRRLCWDKRDEKSVLLELRASGQTMAPGSIHPDTEEPIEWMNEEPLRSIDGAELEVCTMRLAAASLLFRDWQSGGRDELAVCLVGSMVRGDWDDHDIDSFLEPILIESGDEESVKRLKAERLRSELESGGRVPGLKRLRELCSGGGLGLQGFERIVEWLELGGGDILEEINNEFAVVSLRGGGVAIMRERGESGVEFLDKSSFNLLWANRMVGHRGRDVTADRFWLAHKDRREYLKGVVFHPGKDAAEGEYNLWRGFSVAPTEGTWGCGWEIYKDHLMDDVCGGDERIFWWLIGWMAHRVQRPWEVPESAVVLIGERGDGKSSVFKILGALFGKHYMTVTNPRQLMGNFNAHLMDKVLVLADEAVWGGDKTNEGILKVMISEDRRVIEIKGKDAFEVDNCTGYGICSNNDWVVPVGRQERRFLILRTKSGRQGDFTFWDRMYDVMSAGGGGLARMLYDLQAVDLGSCVLGDRWRGNRPPSTDELRMQASRGMEHWVQFLVWKWETDQFEGGEVWVDDLYLEYVSWMGKMSWRHETEKVFMHGVERMLGRVYSKVRRKRIRSSFAGKVGVHTEREARYKLVFKSTDEVQRCVDKFTG
jgi:hypothetical protein